MKVFASIGPVAFGLAAIAALSACDRQPTFGPAEAEFGNAVRQNIAAQVVYPEPQDVDEPITFSGERAGVAMDLYRTDKVKPPKKLRTTEVGSTNSGDK